MEPERSPVSGGEAAILALTRPHPNLLKLYALTSLVGLCAAPIVFVPLYFKYHTLRYRLDEEGISASWGILFRREVHLTYKRIQDIHVTRNFVERWLGLATVQVQTASGSTTAELAFEGIADHEALRDFLYRRMRGHELHVGTLVANAPAGPSAVERPGVSPVVGGARALSAGEAEAIALLREIRAELDAARRALDAAPKALDQRGA
ncbi:MAG: PH domain-containing protein [Planctomycetes bacterium]|nr:PH domain-containing protein [Planctomycetota bacterium]